MKSPFIFSFNAQLHEFARAILVEILQVNANSLPFRNGKDIITYPLLLHHQLKEEGSFANLKISHHSR